MSNRRSPDRQRASQAQGSSRYTGTSRPTSGSRATRSTHASRFRSSGSSDVAGAKRSSTTSRKSAKQAGSARTDRRRTSQQRVSAASHRAAAPRQDKPAEVVSTSVGELRRSERRERAKKASRRHLLRVVVAVGIVVALLAGWAALYNSSAFTIAHVEVNGVEHLTSDEMATLANVPSDTTLLRVDTATIEKRVEQNAWVSDAQINLVFPDTLQINVTERAVFAVVEIPTSSASTVKQWAISKDRIWLMPIPDANSDAAKTTSSKVYEDASKVLHVVGLPIGTKAEIGAECADANVNNAIEIINGLTTELAGRVSQISAPGVAETTLVLDNGVEVAFGKAEDIRDKERVVLQILSDNPTGVAYINVRMVNNPTWRAV